VWSRVDEAIQALTKDLTVSLARPSDDDIGKGGTFLPCRKDREMVDADDVIFVEALTYGATGKVQKMGLRRRFADHYSTKQLA
jgi:hypothetical protein